MTDKKKITKKATKKKAILPKIRVGRRRGGGRPRVKIREYFAKILPYLQRGLSVAKSCEHAGVPHQTVSDYTTKHPEFSAEIAVAKRTLEIAARQNLAKSINGGSIETTKWYLERKLKDEFSLRVENLNENHDGEVVLIKIPQNGREAKE